MSNLPARIAAHWRLRWKSHLGTLVMVLAVMWGVNAWQTRNLPAGLAPNFAATLANGETTTLDQWRAKYPGQAIALHFWADWCPICRTEENSINRLSRDWPILTIAMQSGDTEQVRKVLAKRQLDWPTAMDKSGQITQSYGFKSVPAFVVINARGEISGASMGFTTEMGMRLRLWLAHMT
jgi:thiol-disulfide isomerase/thioredoxin